MIGKKPAEHQMSIFDVALESFIDMNQELVLLSKQIDWEAVESEFAEYYCADNGRPSVSIRIPSSGVSWLLMLVRRLENVLFENENQYAWKDSTLATVAK